MNHKELLILGNMKMNLSYPEIMQYFKSIKKIAKGAIATVGVAVPFVYLPYANHYLLKSNILFGAQNCNEHENGAFTGEISCGMLEDFSCDFCLVGHSERRQMGETNEVAAQKVKKLLEYEIVPVLCIGENLEERQSGKYQDILKEQIEYVLNQIDKENYQNMVIAYEPIWAIGTGIIPTLEQIQDTILYIKKVIADLCGGSACLPQVLYGGSVKPNNIKDIVSIPCVDGVLVGGACLKMEEFAPIINI